MRRSKGRTVADWVAFGISLAATYYVQRKMNRPQDEPDDTMIILASRIRYYSLVIDRKCANYIDRELDKRSK